jgi:hypothetical protein
MSNTQFPFSPVLSNLSIARGLGSPGVGTRVAPLIPGADLKYEYPVFEDHRGTGAIDTERAPGADVKQVESDKYVMEGGIIRDHTVDVKSPIEYSAGAVASQLPILQRAAMKANEAVRRSHETAVRNKLWADNKAGFESIYGAGATRVLELTGTARWISTAPKIRKNVKGLADPIEDATGYRPNTLLLTNELYNEITSVDNEIRDAIKFTQFGVPDLAVLARYFEVAQVIVAGVAFDTANPGLDPSYSKLWNGPHALLAYVNPNPGPESQNLAGTFFADNAMDPSIGQFLGIQPWYDMKSKSNMMRCSAYYDVRLINAKCGAIIFNASA